MNTRLLLSASAIVLATAGIAGSFLPQEILRALGTGPTAWLVVLVQLLAAALFAFGMVNWTARGSLIGGIYNRPVAIGNLTHFTIGALATGKAAIAAQGGGAMWAVAAVYGVFALGFGALFFRSPVSE